MHSLRTTLGALLFATLLGCPGGGGGAGGGGGLASPEEVGAAFQAAVQAGDWGTCYDLVVPAERETMVIKRLGRVVRAAQRAKEASKPLYVAFLDDLGIDPDATPGAEGDSLAKRQALALEAYKSGIDGDYRGTWVELLQLLEQVAEAEGSTSPRVKLSPGTLGEVTLKGDEANGRTTNAMGAGERSAWVLAFRKVDGLWYLRARE